MTLDYSVFFVMSGFLICTMLSRPSKESFFTNSIQFYWRRLKRILPLAYLVFMISYVAMYMMKLKTFVPINQLFGQKALIFGANLRLSEEDEYEKQLTGATILLTHFWSLSTEIQFYFFAPLLVFFTKKSSTRRKLLLTLLLCLVSFIHYTTCSPSVAFNSPFSRLWQFCAGFLAFYCGHAAEKDVQRLNSPEQRQSTYSRRSWISLLTIFACVFYDAHGVVEETLLRVLVTVGSAWIIYAEGKNPVILKISPLVFIGDISYSLYLVHWPVLCFMKYFQTGNPFLTNYGILLCLIVSFAGSVLLHLSFEKPLLLWTSAVNGTVIIILFLICGLLTSHDLTPRESTGDKFFDDAIEANQENIINCRNHIISKFATPYSLPNISSSNLVKFPTGTGNYSFLIIGNSYSINQADMIYDYIRDIAKTVILIWAPTCEALVTTTTRKLCLRKSPPFTRVVELVKPDILLVIERGFTMKTPIKTINVLDDPIMKTVKERITKWQKWTKRIFVMGAIPQTKSTQVTKAVEYLKQRRRLEDSPSLVWYNHFSQKQRLAEIPKFCTKCQVYEWEYIFQRNNSDFQIFNPTNDVVYFDDWSHLGKEGLDAIRPVYQNLVNTIHKMKL